MAGLSGLYQKLKSFYRVPRKPGFGQIYWLMRWDPTIPLDTCWEIPTYFTFCLKYSQFAKDLV